MGWFSGVLFDWVGVGGYHQICYITVTKGGIGVFFCLLCVIRGGIGVVFLSVMCYKGWYWGGF